MDPLLNVNWIDSKWEITWREYAILDELMYMSSYKTTILGVIQPCLYPKHVHEIRYDVRSQRSWAGCTPVNCSQQFIQRESVSGRVCLEESLFMKGHSCCCRILGSWGNKKKSWSSGQGLKGVYSEQVGLSGDCGTTHACPACQSKERQREKYTERSYPRTSREVNWIQRHSTFQAYNDTAAQTISSALASLLKICLIMT